MWMGAVVPFIDHALPNFKVELLPSTEVPSTSCTINAIFVITFVSLVMSCYIINGDNFKSPLYLKEEKN